MNLNPNILEMPLKYSDFPDVSQKDIDLYNTSYTEHQKGRKSLDYDFIRAHYLAEARIMLSLQKRRHPNKSVHWPEGPERYAVIGYVPHR